MYCSSTIKKMKSIFSSTEDEILIENIQKNYVIFDSSDLKHKDVFFKETIWKNISVKLDRTSKYHILNFCVKCHRCIFKKNE